jgi:hypothetical protein
MKITKNYITSLLFFFIATQTIMAQQKEKEQINTILNNWHKAAASADLKAFFAPLTDNFVYIGTDANERWNRQEFYDFCKPYFDKGKAWNFEPIERIIYFSPDGNTAWFNETLNTWMGICRSSGVLVKIKKEWKLAHYQLAVTVPNDKIKPFLECCQTPNATIH